MSGSILKRDGIGLRNKPGLALFCFFAHRFRNARRISTPLPHMKEEARKDNNKTKKVRRGDENVISEARIIMIDI